MAKLTLHVPDELIVVAKDEASSREVSVSKMVTDFFRNLSANKQTDSSEVLSPKTKNLVGCIPDADVEDYIDYLEEKHS